VNKKRQKCVHTGGGLTHAEPKKRGNETRAPIEELKNDKKPRVLRASQGKRTRHSSSCKKASKGVLPKGDSERRRKLQKMDEREGTGTNSQKRRDFLSQVKDGNLLVKQELQKPKRRGCHEADAYSEIRNSEGLNLP